jgi:hypothetical protein
MSPVPAQPFGITDRAATVRAFPAGYDAWEYDVWVHAANEWTGRLRHRAADAKLRELGYRPNTASRVLRLAREQYDRWQARRDGG